MTNLNIQKMPLRSVLERDSFGMLVTDEGKTKSNSFEVPCSLDMSNRELNFNVIVSVRKSFVSDRKSAENLALSWLLENLPRHLENESSYWDFFSSTRLDATSMPSSQEHVVSQRPLRVKLTSVTSSAQSACNEIDSFEHKFEVAKKRLIELVFEENAFHYKETLSEARQLLKLIESVLNSSGSLGGYSPSDARNAIRNYEELARRQVESNHIYKTSLNTLRNFAYGVSLPQTWGSRPAI
jgi:hypothetical protein